MGVGIIGGLVSSQLATRSNKSYQATTGMAWQGSKTRLASTLPPPPHLTTITRVGVARAAHAARPLNSSSPFAHRFPGACCPWALQVKLLVVAFLLLRGVKECGWGIV